MKHDTDSSPVYCSSLNHRKLSSESRDESQIVKSESQDKQPVSKTASVMKVIEISSEEEFDEEDIELIDLNLDSCTPSPPSRVDTPCTESVVTPCTESVDTPCTESVDTPCTESVDTPCTESVDTPFTDSVDTPCTESDDTPCTESVDTPCTESVDTPCTESDDTPCTDSVDTPCTESVDTPCTDSVDTPCTDSVDTPCTDSVDSPCTESVDTPCTDSVDMPCTESVDTPCTDSVDMPCTESVDTPCTDSVDTPCTDSVDMPCTESVDTPCTENVDMPCTESVDTPCTDSVDMPCTESVDTPCTENVVDLNLENSPSKLPGDHETPCTDCAVDLTEEISNELPSTSGNSQDQDKTTCRKKEPGSGNSRQPATLSNVQPSTSSNTADEFPLSAQLIRIFDKKRYDTAAKNKNNNNTPFTRIKSTHRHRSREMESSNQLVSIIEQELNKLNSNSPVVADWEGEPKGKSEQCSSQTKQSRGLGKRKRDPAGSLCISSLQRTRLTPPMLPRKQSTKLRKRNEDPNDSALISGTKSTPKCFMFTISPIPQCCPKRIRRQWNEKEHRMIACSGITPRSSPSPQSWQFGKRNKDQLISCSRISPRISPTKQSDIKITPVVPPTNHYTRLGKRNKDQLIPGSRISPRISPTKQSDIQITSVVPPTNQYTRLGRRNKDQLIAGSEISPRISPSCKFGRRSRHGDVSPGIPSLPTSVTPRVSLRKRSGQLDNGPNDKDESPLIPSIPISLGISNKRSRIDKMEDKSGMCQRPRERSVSPEHVEIEAKRISVGTFIGHQMGPVVVSRAGVKFSSKGTDGGASKFGFTISPGNLKHCFTCINRAGEGYIFFLVNQICSSHIKAGVKGDGAVIPKTFINNVDKGPSYSIVTVVTECIEENVLHAFEKSIKHFDKWRKTPTDMFYLRITVSEAAMIRALDKSESCKNAFHSCITDDIRTFLQLSRCTKPDKKDQTKEKEWYKLTGVEKPQKKSQRKEKESRKLTGVRVTRRTFQERSVSPPLESTSMTPMNENKLSCWSLSLEGNTGTHVNTTVDLESDGSPVVKSKQISLNTNQNLGTVPSIPEPEIQSENDTSLSVKVEQEPMETGTENNIDTSAVSNHIPRIDSVTRENTGENVSMKQTVDSVSMESSVISLEKVKQEPIDCFSSFNPCAVSEHRLPVSVHSLIGGRSATGVKQDQTTEFLAVSDIDGSCALEVDSLPGQQSTTLVKQEQTVENEMVNNNINNSHERSASSLTEQQSTTVVKQEQTVQNETGINYNSHEMSASSLAEQQSVVIVKQEQTVESRAFINSDDSCTTRGNTLVGPQSTTMVKQEKTTETVALSNNDNLSVINISSVPRNQSVGIIKDAQSPETEDFPWIPSIPVSPRTVRRSRVDKMEDPSGSCPRRREPTNVELEARSISVGTYSRKTEGPVVISKDGIKFKIQDDTHFTMTIEAKEIQHCYTHISRNNFNYIIFALYPVCWSRIKLFAPSKGQCSSTEGDKTTNTFLISDVKTGPSHSILTITVEDIRTDVLAAFEKYMDHYKQQYHRSADSFFTRISHSEAAMIRALDKSNSANNTGSENVAKDIEYLLQVSRNLSP